MKNLNNQQALMENGGCDACKAAPPKDNYSASTDYDYLTPAGTTEFNVNTVNNGQTYGLGMIPEGWTRVSDELVTLVQCP